MTCHRKRVRQSIKRETGQVDETHPAVGLQGIRPGGRIEVLEVTGLFEPALVVPGEPVVLIIEFGGAVAVLLIGRIVAIPAPTTPHPMERLAVGTPDEDTCRTQENTLSAQ